MARTITLWATKQLSKALDQLQICEGFTSHWEGGGEVQGEVSVSERRGKQYPIYALEVRLPWAGAVDGVHSAGIFILPDVSVEMLDELEVVVEITEGTAPEDLHSSGCNVVRGAVRAWAAGLRKAVASTESSVIEWDPEQESEDMPAENKDDDERPYTEAEVMKLMETARELLEQKFSAEDAEEQFKELENEISSKELQESGRVLIDVIAFLQNGEQFDSLERDRNEPYSGPEELEQLWTVVGEMCNEGDLRLLEEEMRSRSPEEQWKVLLDVRDHLLDGDDEEQEAFAQWEPTIEELEEEWLGLLKHVPSEDMEEVQETWANADEDNKKSIVWDVRRYVEDQEAERLAPINPQDAEPSMSRSELRRRGPHARAGREANVEEESPGDSHAKYDDHHTSGLSTLAILGIAIIFGCGVFVLTAKALAEEDESTLQSLGRLLHID
eukprot:scaffold167142_cov30-Tisochrysis_lutea.AAC.3